MGQKTGIEWTNKTWNPSTGCDKISPGCKNCYAETLAARLQAMGNKRYLHGFELTLHHDKTDEPKKWKEPGLVFVNSMSDILHAGVPDDFIMRVVHTMAVTAPQHVYQVLTKRAERWPSISKLVIDKYGKWPVNVWPGVTVESRQYLPRMTQLSMVGDDRTIRMVSFEPLLESLVRDGSTKKWDDYLPTGVDGLAQLLVSNGIGWGISGGEAGFGARGHELRWFEELRDAHTIAAGLQRVKGERQVAFFHKQHGGAGVTKTDKKGGELALLEGRLHHAYPSMPSPWSKAPSLPFAAAASESGTSSLT